MSRELSTTVKFSVIVVALNPGEKLKQTIDSILAQEYLNYEIIVKDGKSKDGSVEKLKREFSEESKIKVFEEADKSIYDAMNQALRHVNGDYILFLNCGDTFFDNNVLLKTAEKIIKSQENNKPSIFYGNTFCEQTNVVVHSAPQITSFTCYRNIPCHQSCFYGAELFTERGYETKYRIRADYEHFLWCYYKVHANMIYMDNVIAAYEGGGYSESKKNQKRDQEEHKLITLEYMSKWELIRYKSVMALTLAPLRRWIANSKMLSNVYHRIKDVAYRRSMED